MVQVADRRARVGIPERRAGDLRHSFTNAMNFTITERLDLPVSGMTCAACARSIERTLANTPGVERALVNLATNTATVEFDSAQVGAPDFVRAIEGLGYG